MADFARVIRRYFEPSFQTIWADMRKKKDPDEFPFMGSQIYSGMQGEGKTLGMVYHGLFRVKRAYPKTILVSNLHLRDYIPIEVKSQEDWLDKRSSFNPAINYVLFESFENLKTVLRYVRPEKDTDGVLFMIDEIHNYFHSHDSKAMPMWIVQVFSQQRKQKIMILGTVQIWTDLIKQIRDQIKNLVICSKFASYWMKQMVIDPLSAESNYGEVEYSVKKRGFFFRSQEISNSYDTFQVINSGREIMGGSDLQVSVGVKTVGEAKPKSKANRFYGRR